MARTASNRLNLLGVIALIVSIAACVAVKRPIAGYGPTPIALAAIGLGVVAFLVSLVLRWGSGVPVLAILVGIGALGYQAYDNGSLPAWWAKLHSSSAPKPQPAVTPAPAVVAPAVPQDQQPIPHPHSIFDDPNDKAAKSPAPAVSTPAPAPTPAPAVATPTPPPSVPSVPEPTGPTLAEARAKYESAVTSVEASLANDPAYIAAKAEVTAADAKRKAALSESGAGSASVQEAASEWAAAKGKLRKIVDAAVAKDPSAQAALKDLNAAEKTGHRK